MNSNIAAGTVQFGRRRSPPPPAAGPAAARAAAGAEAGATAPAEWPFTSRNTALRRMLPLAAGFALVGLLRVLPTALQSRSLASFVEQNGLLYVLVMVGMGALMVWGFRRPLQLRIDGEGIFYTAGKRSWQYAWRDVERAIETDRAVRLVLKGRTEAQNRYNLLPATLGLSAGRIEALIAYGAAHCASSSRINTVAPGDDLRRARSGSLAQVNAAMGATLVLALLIAAGVTLPPAADASRLQARGARTTARVTRIFTGGCGRRSCAIFADYAFTAEDPHTGRVRPYSGTERIGSDARPSDPDLLAVRSTASLPVAFDPADPDFSRANFRDRIYAAHPWSHALAAFLSICGILTLTLGAVWGAAVLMMRKRRLF